MSSRQRYADDRSYARFHVREPKARAIKPAKPKAPGLFDGMTDGDLKALRAAINRELSTRKRRKRGLYVPPFQQGEGDPVTPPRGGSQ
jgi:hypothetical protein